MSVSINKTLVNVILERKMHMFTAAVPAENISPNFLV